MKKLILLLVLAFIMCGCTFRTVNGTKVFNNDSMETVLFVDDENDTCEYLYYNEEEFYHKGNCKYCAERRKKEQEELIRRLKED